MTVIMLHNLQVDGHLGTVAAQQVHHGTAAAAAGPCLAMRQILRPWERCARTSGGFRPACSQARGNVLRYLVQKPNRTVLMSLLRDLYICNELLTVGAFSQLPFGASSPLAPLADPVHTLIQCLCS